MKKSFAKYDKQLFICTNKKADGECCYSKGAEDILQEIKGRLIEEDKWHLYKVTRSGCLGGCAEGINAILNPSMDRYEKVTTNDTDSLYEVLTKEK